MNAAATPIADDSEPLILVHADIAARLLELTSAPNWQPLTCVDDLVQMLVDIGAQPLFVAPAVYH